LYASRQALGEWPPPGLLRERHLREWPSTMRTAPFVREGGPSFYFGRCVIPNILVRISPTSLKLRQILRFQRKVCFRGRANDHISGAFIGGDGSLYTGSNFACSFALWLGPPKAFVRRRSSAQRDTLSIPENRSKRTLLPVLTR